MKLSLIALTFVASLSLMGCAADQGMKAQVDQLQQRAHQQDAQIADLEARAKALKEGTVTTSQTAWEWTSQHAQDAWNSDISQDARARFQKCWTDLKTSTK
jgi:outer membrane murein-binding lipoprotein Lpp